MYNRGAERKSVPLPGQHNKMEQGKINKLKAAREERQGWYLVDEAGEEVLLPGKYAPKNFRAGDELEVFVHTDSEDRPVATTQRPKVMLHEFAWLQVSDVNKFGAFMDWGLEKDLFVPFARQAKKMEVGRWYLIYLYLDELSGRLTGASKLNPFWQNQDCKLEPGDQVKILIGKRTDLGFQVVINQKYQGLLYHSEIHSPLYSGSFHTGYIKVVRPDHKIDVSLQPPGHLKIEPNAELLLNKLKKGGGFLPLTDKSAPEDIAAVLGVSKKAFKQALGNLYKKKQVRIEDEGIFLVDN